MARFLLAAMPFTGHVAPMRAVGAELVARGHAVRFYTGSAFRRGIAASGASFVPWRAAPDFDENDLSVTFPRVLGRKGIRQVMTNVQDVFIDTAPTQVADLTAEWKREPWDALVADETALGPALFAERSGCAWATVAVVPLNLPGPAGPPAGLGLVPGRNVATKARDAVLRAITPLMLRPLRGPLARARADTGLPPSPVGFDGAVFSRQLVLASGSPLLDYERSDRPSHLHFTGVLATPPAPADTPSWWSDLDGRHVVHVTQGTQNIDPADLIRPALEALADRDVIVVATTGVPGRDTLPFPVPANARVAGFIPHAQLLPRVDVMITNGGWGGTLGALQHGIPLVIAGGDLDKPEVAARVAWSGAGVNLRTGTPRAVKVAAAYDRVTTDASFRDAAARVADQLRALGGAATAADRLASFVPA